MFVSSDEDSISPGQEWFQQIKESLSCTRVLLAVCSEESAYRPWINFESGAGWIRDIPVIPVCHSGMTVGGLPQPLSNLHGLDVEEDGFARRLMTAVANGLGLAGGSLLSDHQEMEAEIQAALSKIAESLSEIDDMKPNLKLVFALDGSWANQRVYDDYRMGGDYTIEIHMGVQNESEASAEEALVELGVSEGSRAPSAGGRSDRILPSPFRHTGCRTVRDGDKDIEVDWYELHWPLDGRKKIFKTAPPMYVSEFPFKIENINDYGFDNQGREDPYLKRWLFWKIQAPDMNPKRGKTAIIRVRNGLGVSLEEDDGDFEIVDESDEA